MAHGPDDHGTQQHFDPDTYADMVLSEVPDYRQLQDEVARASREVDGVNRVLDLGIGTGETATAVLAEHPGAAMVGSDASEGMLAAAAERLPQAELVARRLEDSLPAGTFDLVISALAVHHLDAAGKADLFARIAEQLRLGGRFVLADLVTPDDPADVVTVVDGTHDRPSSVADQFEWLQAAGFVTELWWAQRDLAVLIADRRIDA